METTGNQNVDLNSQFGTIVATHSHLQLNDILSSPDPHQSILWCTRARASRGSASHVFLVEEKNVDSLTTCVVLFEGAPRRVTNMQTITLVSVSDILCPPASAPGEEVGTEPGMSEAGGLEKPLSRFPLSRVRWTLAPGSRAPIHPGWHPG